MPLTSHHLSDSPTQVQHDRLLRRPANTGLSPAMPKNSTATTSPSSSVLAYQRLLVQLGLEHPTDLPDSHYRRLARKLALAPAESVTPTGRRAA